MADWKSQIAGERMAVDGEFSDRVAASSLSSQQWDLVMTAVSLEIEHPEDPDKAELVADTSHLDTMMGDIDRIGSRSPVAKTEDSGSNNDGFLSGVLSKLGLDDAGNEQLKAEAVELAEAYTEALQAKLVERGRWEKTCEIAAKS